MSRFRPVLIAYAVCAVTFLVLDAAWLTLMNEGLYRRELGDILAAQPRLAPAAVFYVLYLAGVVRFCVLPAIRTRSLKDALANGAMFGLVAYATYDLTNQATLAVWSTRVTMFDLAWGATVTALSALSAAAAVLRFAPTTRVQA